MIYDGYRRESYEVVEVSWPDFAEGKKSNIYTGGKIELSALSTLKASGSLSFESHGAPAFSPMVRIYYTFTDECGDKLKTPLGTFFVTVNNPTYNGDKTSGEVSLSSVLLVPSSASYGRYYTVPAGTNAVARAVNIIEGFGLTTNKPASDYTLAHDLVFEPDETYLTIANKLLELAGYASCTPNALGVIEMTRYQDPAKRPITWSFSDDAQSIMAPDVKVTNDSDTPNTVRLMYKSDDECLWASATVNNQPYEVSYTETLTELNGRTQNDRLANLKAKAKNVLLDKSATVEHVEHTHAWVPLLPNNAIAIDYRQASFTWSGIVTNMSITLEKHLEVVTKARRFVRPDFKVTTEGGIL